MSKKHLQDVSSAAFSLFLRTSVMLMYLPLFLMYFQLPSNPLFWVAAVGSGLFLALATSVFVTGVRRDYYSTYALRNTQPLFTFVLAALILHETVNLPMMLGVFLVTLGVLVFYRMRVFSSYGLLAGILYGTNSVLHKVGIDLTSPIVFPFLAFVFCNFFLAFTVLSSERRRESLKKLWSNRWHILFISLMSFGASLTGFWAVSLEEVSKVTAAGRLNLLFGFILSYFLLKETKDWKYRILGGLFILIGTVVIAFY